MAQKILAGVMGVALLGVGIHDIIQIGEIRHLQKQNAGLVTRIDDPKTGYIVRLTQAETNTATCTAAVQRQNVAIRAVSTRDAAAIGAAQQRYDREHVARVRSEFEAAAILARKPAGPTLIDRVLDVDAQLLGDLK